MSSGKRGESDVSDTPKAAAASPDDMLREARNDAKHWQAQFEAAHWERAEIRQALDASHAETEAAKLQVGIAGMKRCEEAMAALRSLATDLVEGLEKTDRMLACVWGASADGETRGTIQTLLARARAQGIGGEKEKGNG